MAIVISNSQAKIFKNCPSYRDLFSPITINNCQLFFVVVVVAVFLIFKSRAAFALIKVIMNKK